VDQYGDHSAGNARVTFTNPTADWNWGQAPQNFGPEGDYHEGYGWNEWITDNWHGKMIGFIGDIPGDLNAMPRLINQDDLGLFVIGAATLTIISGLSGHLWLGFDDDYLQDVVSDNVGFGSVDVAVSTVPLPPALLLLGSGLLGLGAVGWRRRKV
jgi:hypothetical protein